MEMKIIKKPNYEIIENCSTPPKRILIIFDQNDRNQCYEYFWATIRRKFCCCGCVLKRKHTVAEIWHENTEEYVSLLNDEHVCEMRNYNPAKLCQTNNFVLSPNFEVQTKTKNGNEIRTLIIFDGDDRNLCYSYCFQTHSNTFHCNGCVLKQIHVSAKICQNSDGEEYVILSNVKHRAYMFDIIFLIKR